MDKDLIFETKHWKIILSFDQRYLGRCYIPLKRPCATLSEVTEEEWSDLLEHVIKPLERKAKKAFGAVMFNWTCLMNDSYQNDPPDPQVHFHFRPRYDKKVAFAGIEFEDIMFGSHYLTRAAHGPVTINEGARAKIIEAIRKA